MVDKRDLARAEELLRISETAVEILETARRQLGEGGTSSP